MAHPPWNECYASGNLPWDTGEPDPLLVEFVTSGGVAPGRALEVGSGTGTNAIWLAERGFDVLGVDLSPLAVERARKKLTGASGRCRFSTLDFLAGEPLDDRFDFVFDRGCFHVFDQAEERARFAARVAAALAPGGLWLSLCGSTEGPPRDGGPPRRSAFDLVTAVEPALEIVELRSTEFRAQELVANAWFCLARVRAVPAQPSTRRED
jgi:SAM-dependent methyltransferase